MSEKKNPINTMLKLALATLKKHYKYYQEAAAGVYVPEVKALLMVLVETEGILIEKIQGMLYTGIVEAIDEIGEVELPTPDATPFDPSRNESDPRIFICNKALEQEMKAYTFFLSIAARARSEVISRLYEYFAYVKYDQMEKIRRVCSTL